MSTATRLAERLMAHARLCQHIAEQSWNEDVACKLKNLADECVRAAAELSAADMPDIVDAGKGYYRPPCEELASKRDQNTKSLILIENLTQKSS